MTSCVRLRPVRRHPASHGQRYGDSECLPLHPHPSGLMSIRVAACRCGFAAIGSRQSLSPAALGYEIAGDTLKKVGQGLTWTLGLQDIVERNLRALRRLGKRILGQMIAIWSYRNRV